jgi:serine phosphatase RsbU (regulator of sigma subunit)
VAEYNYYLNNAGRFSWKLLLFIPLFFILVLSSGDISGQTSKPDTLQSLSNFADKAASLDSAEEIINKYTPLDTSKVSKEIEKALSFVNIFEKFTWSVILIQKDGIKRNFETKKPDTVQTKNVDTVIMNARFYVIPKLRNKTIALDYKIHGSITFTSNGYKILSTGLFNQSSEKNLSKLELKGFADLPISDSLQELSFTYLPYHKLSEMSLELELRDLAMAEKQREETLTKEYENYSLGFYYLAFGIVFTLVYMFSRDKTENLYFSLFCLFTSFTYLSSTQSTYIFNIVCLFCLVFSFEFMSFFLAKVLKNKNKSKIFLFIRLILAAICFHPAILYNFTLFGNVQSGNIENMPAPALILLIFSILFSISVSSSIYYLIKGFRQKRWEAKTIVFVCSFAVFISILLPWIVGWIPGIRHTMFIQNLGGIGIYLYPLSAVIVLGRTNRLNQKKLLDQVHSIRLLSEENLEKEKEKQLLLESQNSELENKVAERTKDIIRQKEELEISKQEIELKNKSITDNINYAQRIQSAILPDIKLIYKTLEQSFILFLPKDIVSGDFYSFAERNGRVLLIAGDCTGHGVSGAFMSMIGSSLLNQIINEKGVDEPALILTMLNRLVIEALKQGENESNDGMDISICSFDLAKNELQYAGANRPLWLLRNNTIEVFRPDKFPIGGLQAAKDRSFTNQTIQLTKNDTLYIFTDGYADQFGGQNGKKLMTAKFKEMLLAIQYKGMREQENYLRIYFENWKQENEQVDDVLVIGVRV